MPKRKNITVVPLCESNPEATRKWLTELLVRSALSDTNKAAAPVAASIHNKLKTAPRLKSRSKHNRPYRGPLPKSRFVAETAIVDQAKMERLGIEWATQTDTGKIVMKLEDWAKAREAGAVDVVEAEA